MPRPPRREIALDISGVNHFTFATAASWRGRNLFPRLLRELAAKMAAKGKTFDVMNDMVYWFHQASIAPRELTAQYVELVRLFAAQGVMFQVSSDDHRMGLGNTRWSQIVLARAGVPPHQVVDPRRIRRVDNR